MPQSVVGFFHIFFNAWVFFTRLPAPSRVVFNDNYQRRAASHGPLIGCIIGIVAGGVLLGSAYLLPLSLAIVLSIVTTVLLTGALHEDGFADVCDGFGASREKERILSIMKDSRIGAYGALGLVFILLTKFVVLLEIGRLAGLPLLVQLVIIGHTTSRFAAVSFIYSQDYVSPAASAKSGAMTRRMSRSDLVFATVCALLPCLLLLQFGQALVLVALIPVIALRAILARYFMNRLGGYNGDCLGCVQQLCEVCFYLFACMLISS